MKYMMQNISGQNIWYQVPVDKHVDRPNERADRTISMTGQDTWQDRTAGTEILSERKEKKGTAAILQ